MFVFVLDLMLVLKFELECLKTDDLESYLYFAVLRVPIICFKINFNK